MNTNRIIKYVGITLAILIIINIVMFLFQLVSWMGFTSTTKKEVTTIYNKKIELVEDNRNSRVDFLDIELGASKLTIKESSDIFKIDTNNEYVNIKEIGNIEGNGNTLKIKEKSHWFGDKNVETIIYVPAGYRFSEIKIKVGAGVFEADVLNAEKIDLELGAGTTNIRSIKETNKLDIDTGAGKLELSNAYVNELDLDMGVGEVIISGEFKNADIDAGVGSLTLNLTSEGEYQYVVNKGVGSIKINDESVSNGKFKDGTNLIKIDGGIGSITVKEKSIR